jgi:hypothetical protein
MDEPETPQERDRRARRTTNARRGVVAVGAAGALGAAIAIGATLHTAEATDTETDEFQGTPQGQDQGAQWNDDDHEDEGGDDGQRQQRTQTVPRDQLAAPGGGGQPQGQSAGS